MKLFLKEVEMENFVRILHQLFLICLMLIGVVLRIWNNFKRCKAAGSQIDNKSKRALNCGRKWVHVDLEQVKTIPLNKRTTTRSLASELHISNTKLHKVFKEGLISRHSSSMKPYLKEENKKERLWF